MARINVETDFFADPRFRLLVRTTGGDEARAIGLCIQAWQLAQSYWVKKKLIPIEIWTQAGFDILAAVDLAEVRKEGVYCRGAEKHFAWYAQRIEAARIAGSKSVAARRKKYGTASPRGRSGSERPSNARFEKTPPSAEPESNPLTLTLYADNVKPDPLIPKAGNVWDAYVGAYSSRYGAAPVRNARQMGMCSQLVRRLGGDAAVAVVRFYVGHQGAYYVQKAHALGLCLQDCEALHTQMVTGLTVTRSSAYHADKGAANKAAFDAVAAKWAAEAKAKGGPDGK